MDDGGGKSQDLGRGGEREVKGKKKKKKRKEGGQMPGRRL
jgi:hypothetical protein